MGPRYVLLVRVATAGPRSAHPERSGADLKDRAIAVAMS